MFHVVLYHPEIPPNTGNIIRLCANSGAHLHLIRPLGFELDDKRLRRAGLDYHEYATVQTHDTLDAFLQQHAQSRVFAFSKFGTRSHSNVRYQAGDILLFGSETSGLGATVLARFDAAHTVRIPMRPNNRSLNLSNTVAIGVYEAWRQLDFAGAIPYSSSTNPLQSTA